MKKTQLIAVLTYFAAIAWSSATHYQVYLLGGQSNANGRADAAQLTPPLNVAQTDVRFYWHRTQVVTNVGHLLEDQWIDLAPGSGHGTGTPVYPKEFGPEVSFGRAMANAKPTQNIAIIKYTHGGTNLYSQWAATGTQYTTFVTTVQTALTALTTAGHTYELRGMLWQQGEADTSGSAADNYQTNLTNLIARVRTNLNGGVAFPFVIGSLSNSQYTDITTVGSGPYKVRQAQESVAAVDATVGIVITDGYGVRSDVIHFDHNGQVALGQVFATQMLALEGADLTGPQLSSTAPTDGAPSTPVDSNLVITFNEPIVKGLSGDIVIKQDGGSVFETIPVTDARLGISGSVVTINPSGNFTLNSGYHVQIAAGAIKDLSGNAWTGIADITSWNFTTVLPSKTTVATGTFDENVNATNQVDVEISGGTLGAFKTAVINAYNNNLGGVIDWETGVTTTPSTTTSPNNTLTSIAAAYGIGGSGNVSILFDRSMDLYTNNINSQISVLSKGTAANTSNALIAGGGNDPMGLEYTMTFAGAAIVELGAGIPSRSTYGLNGAAGVNFSATATFSDTTTSVINYTLTASGTDTFLHFKAPIGKTITSFGVKWLSDIGGSPALTNGQRRPILDDLGFIVAAPTSTFAAWITGKPGVNGQNGVNQDPDGDGIDNGIENYFGTEPGVFSQGLVAGMVSGNIFTFTHPLNANPADDLTATYRWSTDLKTFHDDGAPNGAGTTTVTITDPTPAGGERFSVTAIVTGSVIPDKLFIDVKVTQP